MHLIKNQTNRQAPSHLYKYYSVSDNSISCLRKKKFWLSAPSAFNDPFDCKFHVNEYLAAQRRKKVALGKLLTPEYIHKLDATPDRITTSVDEYIHNLNSGIERSGVFCLSSTPFEVLMWSHYSASHTGFCVEFNRTNYNDLGSDLCHPVHYTNRPASLFSASKFFGKKGNLPPHSVFYSKSKSWKYEQEWRLVYMPMKKRPAWGLCKLDADITNIILGLKASDETEKLIKNVFRKRPWVGIYKMHHVPGTLDVLPIKIK